MSLLNIFEPSWVLPHVSSFQVCFQPHQKIPLNHQILFNCSGFKVWSLTLYLSFFPTLTTSTYVNSIFFLVLFFCCQQQLLETVSSTEPHYIHCVKPNNNLLKPSIFENHNVLQQLRCGARIYMTTLSCYILYILYTLFFVWCLVIDYEDFAFA